MAHLQSFVKSEHWYYSPPARRWFKFISNLIEIIILLQQILNENNLFGIFFLVLVSSVFAQSGTLNLVDIQRLESNLLSVTIGLEANNNVSPFSVDIHVLIGTSNTLLEQIVSNTNFQGIPNEQQSVVLFTQQSLDDELILDVSLKVVEENARDVTDIVLGASHYVRTIVGGLLFEISADLVTDFVDSVFRSVLSLVIRDVEFDGDRGIVFDLINYLNLDLNNLVIKLFSIDAEGVSQMIATQVLRSDGLIGIGDVLHVALDFDVDLSDLDQTADGFKLQLTVINLGVANSYGLGIDLDGLDLLLHSVLQILDEYSLELIDIDIRRIDLVDNTLDIDVRLNVGVGSIVSVNVDLIIFSDLTGTQYVSSDVVSFSGTEGVVETLHYDLSDVNLADGLFVLVELSVEFFDYEVDLTPGTSKLYELMNGDLNYVGEPIPGSQQALAIRDAVLEIIRISEENGKIIVSLRLDGDTTPFSVGVIGKLWSIGGLFPLFTTQKRVSFQGFNGEVQNVAFSNIPLVGDLFFEVILDNLRTSRDLGIVDISESVRILLSTILNLL